MVSITVAVILLIVTPVWYAFVGMSIYKGQKTQAWYELLVAIVCTALLLATLAHAQPGI